MKVLFVSQAHENLGIQYLSAALKNAGFETALAIDPRLFNETGFIRLPTLAKLLDGHKAFIREAAALKPGLLCFSVMTDSLGWALQTATELKRLTGAKAVFGGIHPTSLPEETLRTGVPDFICAGEGDAALVELACALRDGKDYCDIPNIGFMRDGSPVINPPRPPIEQLDNLPFPDKELYYSRYPFFNCGYLAGTSRGCPHACAYCCNNVYHCVYGGKWFRRRTPASVIDELKAAKARWNPPFVHFVDEVLNSDEEWLAEFAPRYREAIGLPFSCYAFPDALTDRTTALLAEAGCFKVQTGLQVYDDKKRTGLLRRPSTREATAAAINRLRKRGIYATVDIILGFPDETEAELRAMLEFFLSNRPDNIEVFFLKCYPKAAITEWAKENKYVSDEELADMARGVASSGIVRPPEGKARELSARYARIFTLLPLLSDKRARAMAQDGERITAILPLLALKTAVRIANHPKHDFFTLQFKGAYRYFAKQRLANLLGFGQ